MTSNTESAAAPQEPSRPEGEPTPQAPVVQVPQPGGTQTGGSQPGADRKPPGAVYQAPTQVQAAHQPVSSPVGPPDVLGTPLSPTATRVMILGAGELGKELVIAFQRLGVEVVAVDRYENAPAHQVAHHAAVIDMTDGDAIVALIEKYQPHYVVPEIEAIATEALEVVEKRGLAEVIPTARAVVATMNREGIRRLADEELGLPTSPYLFAGSRDEMRVAVEQVGYPCVVKPVMSSSGKGQTVLKSAADIDAAWDSAITGGRVSSERVIVEGWVDFDYEITLLTVRAIDPATGRLATHFCAPIGHQQVGGDYVESWQPHDMSTDALGAATSIAARVATALGDGKLGGRGIFGVELFVKGDDVYFSEVSPRPHDTGLVTLATQRLSEFEMHARAILGLPVDVTLASPGASAVIYGQLEEKAIGFENVARALAVPETDIRLFGKPESFHRRRVGVVTATADDITTARERAVRAASIVAPVSGRPARRGAPAPVPPAGRTRPAVPGRGPRPPAPPAGGPQAGRPPAGGPPRPGRPPVPPGGPGRPPGRPPVGAPVPPGPRGGPQAGPQAAGRGPVPAQRPPAGPGEPRPEAAGSDSPAKVD
ncbi:formate-dependent phosphoribosylglycinamide formyltransferase [Gordonia sp. DT219]|uniref:formate-dependent phosphoribosylglycinamide formyltransferase n=1 Tax=Gordonia sp. DT219 TaxID=3416658 RepID=UPI003CF79FD2